MTEVKGVPTLGDYVALCSTSLDTLALNENPN